MSALPAKAAEVIAIKRLILKPFGQGNAFELRINHGERVAIVGPRDQGQAELMRVLSGAVPIVADSARMLGAALHSDSAVALNNLGYFSGQAGIFAALTVREQLEFLELANNRCAPGCHEDCLSALQLTPFANVRISELTALNLRKLRLASAIINDPQLLLLDNPTHDLPEQDKKHLTELLREVVHLSPTTLLATDDATLAATLTKHAHMMLGGRLGEKVPVANLSQSVGSDAVGVTSSGPVLEHCAAVGSAARVSNPANKVLRVQTVNAEKRLEQLLETLPGVAAVVRQDESTVLVTHCGMSGFGSDVAAKLADHGIRISAVHPEPGPPTSRAERSRTEANR